MAQYRVIYWNHIPTMVLAVDESGEARVKMPARFQAAVDAYAMATGVADDESYSAGWRRSDWETRDGSAAAVAEAVAADLDAAHPSLQIPRPGTARGAAPG
jgi:hypothetical protein